MTNFLQYILGEVKNKRLARTEAVEMICQYKAASRGEILCFADSLLQQNTSHGRLLLEPVWYEQAAGQKEAIVEPFQHVVILLQQGELSAEYIENKITGVRCLVMQDRQEDIAKRFETYASSIMGEIQSLLKEHPRGKILLQLILPRLEEHQLLGGLSGLLKTAQLEHTNFIGQLVEVNSGEDVEEIIDKLIENSQTLVAEHIRYEKGKRWVRGWKEIEIQSVPKIPWKKQGVYLITGGVGGLGLIFAKAIAKEVEEATLILTGRSVLTAEKQKVLNELQAAGARVVYQEVDVTREEAVSDLIDSIKENFGTLHGILHCAGVIRDNLIRKSNKKELQEVLAPKVTGLFNLDQASQLLPLDFFVLFSSMTGALGNIGQAGYAAANAFMDEYAAYRNTLVELGKRQGHTLSVNWPLWQDGGMGVDVQTKKFMEENLGMIPMQTSSGIAALYQGLEFCKSQIMVVEGNTMRLKQKLLPLSEPQQDCSEGNSLTNVETGILLEKVQAALVQFVSKQLKVKVQDIDIDTHWTEYGFDSILFTEFANGINQTYKLALAPPVFYEYPTIKTFAYYLLEEYEELLRAQFMMRNETERVIQTAADNGLSIVEADKRRMEADRRVAASESYSTASEPVAIVGMSGIFPMAKDLNAFWNNLVEGRDCISETPKERWDWRQYYGDPKTQANKTNIKWGGFIDGIDEFDPLFFGISPREAELMDPQQRLTMSHIWKAIEDAGYGPLSLSETNTGIFVGTMSSGYSTLISQGNAAIESYTSTGIVSSVGPNRMSYFLNFHGPSEPVETACSSSLVAIHRAVSAIESGQCDMAVAGGVNIIVTPEFQISLNKAGMLCEDGRCKTFSDQANGYVRGEGVGMVFLKRLKEAEADGDHIYGIIRATAENHGGRANSLTAPNPKAQAQVIKSAYTKAGIDSRTVTYIEAHGTGTELGDPIEINGLKSAFKDLYQSAGEKIPHSAHCGLGSVKSNIGHTELAAGIAGVIKVLLQMKYKKLVKTLHCKKINPYIQLQDSPFYILRENREWEALLDSEGKEIPRRAGVSSFGFGGVNAHVVLEEYIPKQQENPQVVLSPENPVIIVLSAKNRGCLKEQVRQLLATLRENPFSREELVRIAYTLQVGRDAMEERLAVLATSTEELVEKLTTFIVGRADIDGLYQGRVKENKEILETMADEDMSSIVEIWLRKRKYRKLLALWVQGLPVAWNKLYHGARIGRVSLPSYPFAKERYWITRSADNLDNRDAAHGLAQLHPLLHENTSDLSEERFSSTFTGLEFFLADHIVKGQRVLPGVAYLEMARAAIEHGAGIFADSNTRLQIKNIVWLKPIVVREQPLKVNIGLYPEENGQIAYTVYSKVNGGEPVVHSQGTAVASLVKEMPVLDIQSVQVRCRQTVSACQIYDTFYAMGIDYGAGHRGIDVVYKGENEVLAKLVLPESVTVTAKQFVLHPSLLDSALQASLCLVAGDGSGSRNLALPFALGEMEILRNCSNAMWALIRYSEGSSVDEKVQKLDIDLCDEEGNICVRIKEFTSRILEGEIDVSSLLETAGTLQFVPSWREQAVLPGEEAAQYDRRIVVLCEPEEFSQDYMESKMNGVRCLILKSKDKGIAERFQSYAVRLFEEVQSVLKGGSKVLVQVVTTERKEGQLFFGFAGLLKTAQLENPNFVGQLVGIEQWEETAKIIEKLEECSRSPLDQDIRYQGGKRWVAGWDKLDTNQEEKIPWKEKGVYLITGGAGGLGQIFARDIAQKVKEPTLILTGRSLLDEDKKAMCKELADLGAKVEYRRLDITQKHEVIQLLQSVQKNVGNLSGILHCAGVKKDNFIIKKTVAELHEVLEAKVSGLVILDEACKDMPLDFFVFSSSGAGVNGNIGQADYAMANAFMDAYADYRNRLVAAGQRQGKTLSMDWPLWKDGGMQVEDELANLWRSKGVLPLETSSGIAALYQGLAFAKHQMMVVTAKTEGFGQNYQREEEKRLAITPSKKILEVRSAAMPSKELEEKAGEYFKQLLSNFLKLPVQQIEEDAQMEKYGINSMMILQLTGQLEGIFGRLSKTLFFEYQTLRELTRYFLSEYPHQLIKLLDDQEAVEENQAVQKVFEAPLALPVDSTSRHRRFAGQSEMSAEGRTGKACDIAIIGVSGRYPEAENIQEFWQNLRDGKDCITEIPKERWDYTQYFDQDRNKAGKIYSKWGGFLRGVDQFDPHFFNISPRDAMLMEPQERLFLECVYETMEDAGYTRESLGLCNQNGLPGNVGVYVGVMYEEYQLYGVQAQMQGKPIALFGNPASIANRVSYFCNFHGPSIAIDTMCSSSLTAIHLACQALRQGGCEMAIAGGVNVSIHPNKYLLLSQGKFVSSKGRCESFGEGGDGYVPGEGVGAVLLKPLSKAIFDGDHIYGVIKASTINHGGKTNGYSVPNPNAQTSVILQTIKEAGVDARTISYIEAHGTGTSLGDPIEIAGLTKAFKEYTNDTQFCAIGSAKSNIGHCESAAGIAALTKVLLQLKYQMIVPSLHAEMLNPNIDFNNTPFVVQQKLEEWKRPVIEMNGQSIECPRIAGLSSFGAGGSNAHLIIEEYVPAKQSLPRVLPQTALVVLSAKNEERLQEQVRCLVNAIKERQLTDENLVDAAYTLQIGREGMEERLGVLVKSSKELEEKLNGFAVGQEGIEQLYRGQVSRSKEIVKEFAADGNDIANITDAWVKSGNYEKLLEVWVKGLAIDWNKLYDHSKPRRISLPTYPFTRERYWFTDLGQFGQNNARMGIEDSVDRIARQQEKQPALALKPAGQLSFSSPVDPVNGILLQPLVDYGLLKAKEQSPGQTVLLKDSDKTSATDKRQLPITVEKLQEELAASLAEALYMKQKDINREEKFIDMGLDSIVGIDWVTAINQQYSLSIKVTEIYNYPTIREFAEFLIKKFDKQGAKGRELSAIAAPSLSVPELVQQLQQGKINIEQASQLFQQLANQ